MDDYHLAIYLKINFCDISLSFFLFLPENKLRRYKSVHPPTNFNKIYLWTVTSGRTPVLCQFQTYITWDMEQWGGSSLLAACRREGFICSESFILLGTEGPKSRRVREFRSGIYAACETFNFLLPAPSGKIRFKFYCRI